MIRTIISLHKNHKKGKKEQEEDQNLKSLQDLQLYEQLHMKIYFDRISSPNSLAAGIALMSYNRIYFAQLRDDGCLYVCVSNELTNPTIIWSSQSSNMGIGPYVLQVQEDGSIVIYDTYRKPIWKSKKQFQFFWKKPKGPFSLVMESNGNLVLYNKNMADVWETKTAR